MKTPSVRLLALLAFAGALSAPARAASPEYAVVSRYLIGGTGGYDYLRVDAGARWLYVAHEKRFEVLDADTGKKVGEIGPTVRAHGVALSPETGHGFATSGIDDLITMFDPKTLATLKIFKSTGSNPDAIEYDPESKKIYVGNHGGGDVTVIDPASGEIVATTKLEGKLEGIGFDGRGRGYVIAEDKSAVHVFDTHTFKPKATWSLAPGEGGTGLGSMPRGTGSSPRAATTRWSYSTATPARSSPRRSSAPIPTVSCSTRRRVGFFRPMSTAPSPASSRTRRTATPCCKT